MTGRLPREYLDFGVVLLIGAVLAASLPLLFPSNRELGIIYFRDKEFDKSRALLLAEYQKGVRTPSVVGPLADLYLQSGEVNRAISLLEVLDRNFPDRPDVLRRLTLLYQYAQRSGDYLAALERLRRLDPREEELRDLAAIYNYHGRYQEQIEVLREILAHGWGGYQDLVAISHLEAARGNREAALRALEEASRLEGTPSLLQVSLMIDTGRVEEAASALTLLHRQGMGLAEGVDLALERRSPETAFLFLDQNRSEWTSDPTITLVAGRLLLDLNRPGEAWEVVAQGAAASLPEGRLLMAEAALATGRVGEAAEILLNHPTATDDRLLLEVIDALLDQDQVELARRLADRLQQPGQVDRPVVLLKLAVRENDQAAASRWEELALKRQDLPLEDALFLLAYLSGRTTGSKVDALLERVITDPSLTPGHLPMISRIMINQGKVAEGEQLLARLAARFAASPEAAWARLILAAASGRRGDIQAWLAETRPGTGDQRLLDLYFLAMDHHQPESAVLVAEYLARDETPAHLDLLAKALAAAGSFDRAVAVARRLPTVEPRFLETLHEILSQAVLAGHDQWRPLLARVLLEKLPRAGQNERRQIFFDLAELGAIQDALPELKQAARTDPGLGTLYLDTLVRMGRKQEALAEARRQATSTSLTAEAARALVPILVSLGDKGAAVELLQRLIETAGPGDGLLSELLYLWGPRPGEEALAWIRRQAIRAAPAARVPWLEALEAAGAYEEVALLSSRWLAENPALFLPWKIRAFARLDDRPRLAAALDEATRFPLDAATLRTLMKVSRDAGFPARTRFFAERLISLDPADPEAYRLAGSAAFAQEDFRTARAYLVRYLSLAPSGDFESHFYLAECLLRAGDRIGARRHYRLALDQIKHEPTPTFFMRHLAALISQRLGRYDQAARLLAELLQERPGDQGIRNDLAETLLLKEQPGRSLELLQGQAPTSMKGARP